MIFIIIRANFWAGYADPPPERIRVGSFEDCIEEKVVEKLVCHFGGGDIFRVGRGWFNGSQTEGESDAGIFRDGTNVLEGKSMSKQLIMSHAKILEQTVMAWRMGSKKMIKNTEENQPREEFSR